MFICALIEIDVVVYWVRGDNGVLGGRKSVI